MCATQFLPIIIWLKIETGRFDEAAAQANAPEQQLMDKQIPKIQKKKKKKSLTELKI
jgi:hypothetical protein